MPPHPYRILAPYFFAKEFLMLEQLSVLSPDPILGLAAECRADPNPNKIDLTVGIYMDEAGVCPVFQAVRQAQEQLVADEVTKAYLPAAGDAAYLSAMKSLVFGEELAGDGANITAIQTPGGCGALRIASEVLAAAAPDATVWISNPTWPVHIPLMGSVGLKFKTYSYYDPASHGVDFEGMASDLKGAKKGDVVLLHGCCHNPSGADLTLEQWGHIADMAEIQGFTVLVDLAYQGMGTDLETDVAGLRLLADRLGELIVAASCSKNLGLYRERTGVALFFGKDAQVAEATHSHGLGAARRVYSMPPAHGALLAGRVLSDPALRASWELELQEICARMIDLRTQLSAKLSEKTNQDFSFISKEKGMFSFLGLSVDQARGLRKERGLYMLDSSRINVAALNQQNMDIVIDAVASVL
jgi:aspartate aminotransferase